MRSIVILLMPLLAAGCAMPPTVVQDAPASPPAVAVAAAMPTKPVETRYDVGGYREGGNPAVRHEAHAVYRRTRVSVSAGDDLETVPRETYPPASVTPLPASEELTAELATQRKITSDLREMQAALADAEEKMKAQYATLVRQTAEVMEVRQQLEAERERLRIAAPAEPAPTAPPKPAAENSEVRW